MKNTSAAAFRQALETRLRATSHSQGTSVVRVELVEWRGERYDATIVLLSDSAGRDPREELRRALGRLVDLRATSCANGAI